MIPISTSPERIMNLWKIFIKGSIGSLFQERIRKNIPCNFSDGISKEQFEIIAKRAGKHIRRLTDLTVDGPVVSGTVQTNSGISEWYFKADFNDYGHITGIYWLSSDNDDSDIPKRVADNISAVIQSFLKEYNVEEDNDQEHISLEWSEQLTGLLKKKRRIKKAKTIISLLLLTTFLCGGLYVNYKYSEYKKSIEIGISSTHAIGKNYEQVVDALEKNGFINIDAFPEYDLGIEDIDQENTVSKIEIRRDAEFDASSKYPYDARIKITYHMVKNIYMPVSYKDAKKMNYTELEDNLNEAGFVNIITQAEYDLITGWLTKDGSVKDVSINGDTGFSENSLYRPDVEIIIIYHTFKKNNEDYVP